MDDVLVAAAHKALTPAIQKCFSIDPDKPGLYDPREIIVAECAHFILPLILAEREAATLEGIRIMQEAAAEAARGTNADLCKTASQAYRIMLGAIRALDPATVLAEHRSKNND